MKHRMREKDWLQLEVAPFTGAWIETDGVDDVTAWLKVAPFTGAWIETLSAAQRQPTRQVAPFTGAWIETVESRASGVC